MINLVIDNHAQYFIVVPGAINLVQGPTNYHRLLRMGVPPSQLRLAGGWIPKDLVVNLEADCQARIATSPGPTLVPTPTLAPTPARRASRVRRRASPCACSSPSAARARRRPSSRHS